MKSSIYETLHYSKNIIVSPDIDGFTCAKIMHEHLGSTVVGTYDKNILTIADGIDPVDCLFVDCDMNAPFVSIGNHMRQQDDNMHEKSFNPNTHYQVERYGDKFPYSTAFLIAFAIEEPTTLSTKICMSYADSTYKNAIKYYDNMHAWSTRLCHNGVLDENVEYVLDHANYLDIDQMAIEYPRQGFVSRRKTPTNYIKDMEFYLTKWQIPFLPLGNYHKFETGFVDKNTVKRYMDDIISYAEVYTNEFSVTYKDKE